MKFKTFIENVDWLNDHLPIVGNSQSTLDDLQTQSFKLGRPIRVFRGEGDVNQSPMFAGSPSTGGWFTIDLAEAQRYAKENNGKVYYVDIWPNKKTWMGIMYSGNNMEKHLILPPDLVSEKMKYGAD